MSDYLDEALPNNNLRGVIIANYATAAALPAYTYANGTAGVGATITYNATGVPATVDAQAVALNDIMFMRHGTDAAHNGPYKCTTLGAVGVAQVWTRAAAADTAAKLASSQISVATGTLLANTDWELNLLAASITVGTTALQYTDQRRRPPPSYAIQFFDDFCAPTTTFIGTSALISTINWQVALTGTATTCVAGANTTGVVGLVSIGTGTDITGRGLFETYGPSINMGICMTIAAGDAFDWEWKAATPTASDGTNTFVVRIGWGNAAVGAAPAEGIWFEWDANSDTHILCKTATGGTPHTAATTTVVAGTGYHKLRVSKPANSTTVTFYIDDVAVGTDTCPTAALAGPLAQIVKSAGGTTRLMNLDWFWLDYRFGTAR